MTTERPLPSAPPPATRRSPQDLLASVEALVHKRVNEMAPHLSERERADAVQSARAEAWQAALRYEPAYGTRFTSYAASYITGGIASYLRGETRQTKVKRHLAQAGMANMAETSDRFDLFADTDEEIGSKLAEVVERQLAAQMIGIGTAPPDPEASVMEEHDRRVAADVVERALVDATPGQRAIVEMWYRHGQPLRDVAAATGRSERSLRRDHDDLLDKLRMRLKAAGITKLPAER